MSHAPRVARLFAGLALVVAGIAMLVLPGPGLLTLLGAAHLLSRDIPGLRRFLVRVLPERWVPAEA